MNSKPSPLQPPNPEQLNQAQQEEPMPQGVDATEPQADDPLTKLEQAGKPDAETDNPSMGDVTHSQTVIANLSGH